MYERLALEQLVPGDVSARPPAARYSGRFERWEQLASVRRRPRRLLAADSELYFPPELHPVVGHPLVAARGEQVVRTLLLYRLYDYLNFTVELESLAVIPVATAVARGKSGLHLPEQMRADAFKIVTDEAWHAQFSYDFACQVEVVSGVSSRDSPTPPAFARRLDELREVLPPELRGLESLLFAIVSETLISGILSDIPRDTRLAQPVRDLVRDHAEDEGRHHIYFRSVLKHLWPALTARERSAVGPHIPAAIFSFLEPDYAQLAVRLASVGLTAAETEQVIAESCPAEELSRSVAQAASPAVRYFAEIGALDEDRTRDAFAGAGLHPPLDAAARTARNARPAPAEPTDHRTEPRTRHRDHAEENESRECA
ncbi:hypothetical protein ABH931_007787 [Streptacidiphilus sp. MAP12-33]|uniref:diiron oxygenase n=1 Tax=Streptacidiphilus sp. MAP12-33 TaxID=3156266 RepID=UPI0035149090